MTQVLDPTTFQRTICGVFVRVCARAGNEYRVSSVTMCFLTSRKFCYSRFGWNSRKTEETLQPVLKQLSTQQVKTSYCIDCIYLSLYNNLKHCWSISSCLNTKSKEKQQDQNENTLYSPTLCGNGCTNICLASGTCSGGGHFIDGGWSGILLTFSSVQITHCNHFLDWRGKEPQWWRNVGTLSMIPEMRWVSSTASVRPSSVVLPLDGVCNSGD